MGLVEFMNLKREVVQFAVLCLLVSGICAAVAADDSPAIRLPSVIGDNMVLQRDQVVPIWGWSVPGAKVIVQFAGQTRTATADSGGRWEVRLRSMRANAVPSSMTITATESCVLTNILVGEVWLCSGQSNMEKPIGDQRGQRPTVNAAGELATGDQFPQIRLFKVLNVRSSTRLQDVRPEATWTACSSNALEVTKFSAVGYFFGREICRKVNVPVGLIESSWGGTMIEPWTPAEAYQSVPRLADLARVAPGDTNLAAVARPAVIYNAMIAPLAPFGIRGVLWYQGEQNCKDAESARLYRDKMEAMIWSWRKLWDEGSFPFYYVQLAPYTYYTGQTDPRVASVETLPQMWEAQTAALRSPRTGMAVIYDTVDNLGDVHPVRKREVGERLARIALAQDYRQKAVCSGPTFGSVRFAKGIAVVRFDHVDGGLVTNDGKPPTWFEIAGADGKYVTADAVTDGDKVIVSSPGVPAPKAVRLGWSELAQPNLFNGAGLPVRPFRTDSW